MVQIHFHALSNERCRGELSPSLGIVSVIVANNDATRRSVCHVLQDVCTKSLATIVSANSLNMKIMGRT